jgi:ELWxxDGT repeat protein
VETLESRTLLSAQLVSDAATPGTLRLEMVAVGTKLFFNGYYAEHATELWVRDGTAGGTGLVKDLDPATTSQVSQLRNVGGTLMFYAVTPEAGGAIWKSDGTAAGTVMAVDPLPGPEFASIRDLTVVNGRLFFSASVNGTSSVYQTDGTAAGTRVVTTISSFSGGFTASGNKLYWVDSGALRLYDRTLDAVYTVNNAGAFPGNLTDVNGTLYFTASDTQTGVELWKVTNNSTAARVKDVRPGTAGSYPQNLTNVNGTLMFYADDGAGQRGLWKSNGTSSGTTFVKAAPPMEQPTVVGNVLYFRGNDGSGYALCKSDGTAAGTAMVARNDPSTLASAGSYLFFVARGEPWRSDGTAAGTVPIADINLTGSSDPARPTVMGQHVYFMASDGVGRHLWRATVQPGATVSGTVFNDFDGDGVRDTSDNPLPGRTVYDDADNDGLLDPAEWRTVTDEAGVYRLDGLSAGTHRVRLYLPPRWKQTSPPGGAGYTVMLTASQTVTGKNFSAQGTAPAVAAARFEPALTAGALLSRRAVLFDFTEDVGGSLGADDLVVKNLDTGQTVPASAVQVIGFLTPPAGMSSYAAGFAFNSSVPAGRYQATLRAAGVSTPDGYRLARDYVLDFVMNGTVLGRRLFYNHSSFDGNDPAATAADDGAVAADKFALLPGFGFATSSNYSSYSRGINGLMVDLVALPAASRLSADAWMWSPAPAPAAVVLRRGAAAVAGGDRVEITWPDGAVHDTWLRVTVKANADTGLVQPDVFFFGSLVGDPGPDPTRPPTGLNRETLGVTPYDLGLTRRAVSTRAATRTNRFDFDRDGKVTYADVMVVRRSLPSHWLHRDVAQSAAPVAPASDAAVATALHLGSDETMRAAAPMRRAAYEVLQTP